MKKKQFLLQKLIGGFLAAFNRRVKHSKISNPVNRLNRHKIVRNGRKVRSKRYSNVIAYVRSLLSIKREGSQLNLGARMYKRAFGGVSGARTWADFEKGRNTSGTREMAIRVYENRVRREPWYAARAAKAAQIRGVRENQAERVALLATLA